MKPIPYGRQSISEEDIRAVTEVLRSDFLTQGPAIDRFETAVAKYCGATHAVAIANATGALHLACLALGLGKGDLLWTSPNSFVASANCALYCGADVDFVDIDPLTYNMSTARLEEKLEHAKKAGRLPKVVVPVHFAGQSCDMATIGRLARTYGFKVLEDASHAIGGSYQTKPVGSCTYSDVTVFSFHPVKIITSGEGGMLVTNQSSLHAKLLRLRSHGITRDPALMTHAPDGPWYYQQIELGYNYRITDIQAALGLSQLDRVDEFVEKRHALARHYDLVLSKLPMQTPFQNPEVRSALHLYPIRLKLDGLKRSRRQIFEDLVKRGILVNLHYIPIHLQPYYANLGFKAGRFPEAEQYYSEAMSLPLYFGLSREDQDRVVSALEETLS